MYGSDEIGSYDEVDGAPEGELHLPADLARLPVMAVLKGSPAWGALLRMCRGRPGQSIPVSEEEMRALREDVLVVCPAPAREAPEGR